MNSGGIACAFKRQSGIKANKVGKIPGHLLAIDLSGGDLPDFCTFMHLPIYNLDVSFTWIVLPLQWITCLWWVILIVSLKKSTDYLGIWTVLLFN